MGRWKPDIWVDYRSKDNYVEIKVDVKGVKFGFNVEEAVVDQIVSELRKKGYKIVYSKL